MTQVPPGTYFAKPKVDFCVFDYSKNKGTPFVRIVFEPEGIEHSDKYPPTVAWTGWLTEKAEQRTCDTLTMMGWRGDLNNLFDLTKRVQIEVEYQQNADGGIDERYTQVKWVNDPDNPHTAGAGKGAAAPPDLVARMKARHATAVAMANINAATPKQPGGPRAQHTTRHVAPNPMLANADRQPGEDYETDEDQIPF